MFGIEWLLAAFLLQGPDASTLQPQETVIRLFSAINKPLQQLALSSEILDHREIRYVLVRPDEFIVDLRMLQRRQHDLYHAPALAEAQRFPDRSIVNELLIFNRSYRQHLDACLPLYPASAELRTAREEVEQLYQIWDAVRDARCEYYYVHIRRQALKRLSEMLGPEDFQNGSLPPHVPVWRFTTIK